jgi:hypothetical protein
MTMLVGLGEERDRIESEARRLARSGEHSGWWSIKTSPQVPHVFNDLFDLFRIGSAVPGSAAPPQKRLSHGGLKPDRCYAWKLDRGGTQ